MLEFDIFDPVRTQINTPSSKKMRKIISNFFLVLLPLAIGLVFTVSCNDDPEPEITTVTDIDGNVYHVVTIGFYEWTVENLRVSRYNNGDPIITGLSSEEWENTTDGAYTIYPHTGGRWPNEPVEGIHSDAEMVEAYGKLYNWYAVSDPRGLCPEGWQVPSDYAWTTTVDIASSPGYPNDFMDPDNPNSLANALRSCLQVGSRFGEDCDTHLHPRWNSHEIHHGFDAYDFAALPAGYRSRTGDFWHIGSNASWWTRTEYDAPPPKIHRWSIRLGVGDVETGIRAKTYGYSVRCVREVLP